MGGIRLDLPAEVPDVDVDLAIGDRVVVAPDGVEESLSAQDRALIANQVDEKAEFAIGQGADSTRSDELLARQVHHEIGRHPHPRRSGDDRAQGMSAEQGVDLGEDLVVGDRPGEPDVAAGLQRRDMFRRSIGLAKQQEEHAAFPAQGPTKLHQALTGEKSGVEQHEVDPLAENAGGEILDRLGDRDVVTVRPRPRHEIPLLGVLAIDDQQTHRSVPIRSTPGRCARRR